MGKVHSHELQEYVLRNESKEIQSKEHSCGVTTYRPLPLIRDNASHEIIEAVDTTLRARDD